MVIDSTGDTPHLYVSDPYNHRVLGFRDVRKLKPGSAADIVIGQPDLATALCNYPTGDINQPTQSSLCRPIGLLVDANGNLYVADSGNGRVLRFPTPFSHQGNQQADLVLGKPNFFTPRSHRRHRAKHVCPLWPGLRRQQRAAGERSSAQPRAVLPLYQWHVHRRG